MALGGWRLDAGCWVLDDAVGMHCWSSKLKTVPGDLDEQAMVKLKRMTVPKLPQWPE